MTTLTEFLLARIAEDEQVATKAAKFRYLAPTDSPWGGARAMVEQGVPGSSNHFLARFDPARVLAECAAKRAIVERHCPRDERNRWCDYCKGTDHAEYPCETSRILAAVYADHADFDPAWA